MLKGYPHILIFCITLLSTLKLTGQISMPDNVCVGETRRYRVDQHTGSNYKWKIDGIIVQTGPSNELNHTWDAPNTYTIEVQESTTTGCVGTPSSGEVIVHPNVTPAFPAIGPLPLNSLAPPLPVTSSNGISGIWSPTSINTSVAGTSTYTFTPSAGQCGVAATAIVMVLYCGIKYTMTSSDYNGFNVSCSGLTDGAITLNPPDDLAPFTFRWYGPSGYTSSSQNISELSAGQYKVTITDKNKCITMDTIILTEPQKMNISVDAAIGSDGIHNINCAGYNTGSVYLLVKNSVGTVNYLWDDGFIGYPRPNLSAGNYKIIVTDANNCHAETSVNITEPDPIKLSFNVTDAYCADKTDGEINLSVTGGNPGQDYTYRWSNNSTERNQTGVKTGLFRLTVSDLNGCSVFDSVQVKPKHNSCLLIPAAFTPNGDLINDYWNIGNIDLYPEARITIYNRWGQLVWRSESGYAHPWDGKSNGTMLPVDAYHFIIDLHNGSKPVDGAITIVDEKK